MPNAAQRSATLAHLCAQPAPLSSQLTSLSTAAGRGPAGDWSAGAERASARPQAEAGSGTPSVALGRLGPPELSKLLFEAELLRNAFGSLENVLEADDATLSEKCVSVLESSGVARTAPSIGIPILLPDGKRLLRGPRINVPELEGHNVSVSLADAKLDAWAKKGWIDLRPANLGIWRARVGKMLSARASLRAEGSAAASIHSFMATGFEIGEVVAWIFNNEMGGYRVK